MLHNFRSYQLAVQFYRQARGIKAPHYLNDQLRRAAMSVALNLSEGSAKDSIKDRRRFYQIALGSTRECEALIDLLHPDAEVLRQSADTLARHIYLLWPKPEALSPRAGSPGGRWRVAVMLCLDPRLGEGGGRRGVGIFVPRSTAA